MERLAWHNSGVVIVLLRRWMAKKLLDEPLVPLFYIRKETIALGV
jgi:hypothetical protein